MAIVTSAFANAMSRAAGLKLSSKGEILSGAKILYQIDGPVDEKISDSAYFDLIDWIREFNEDEPQLVFQYAMEFDYNDVGALGLAAKSALTLRDAFIRLERYFKLVTDIAVYRLDESSNPAQLVFEARTEDRPALQLRDECALAAITNNIKGLVGPTLKLDHVSFRHNCRDDPARFEAFFGCEVRFGVGRNAIALRHEMLDLPNRLGDQGISDFLTQHLEEEFSRLSNESSLKENLLRHLSPKLSNGVPQAAEIAQVMDMSERTFYRRLAREGLSYRDVLQDAQSTLARELLSETDCSIAEVAFLTGFSEQSTFSRAFKRWVGETPAKFRQLP